MVVIKTINTQFSAIHIKSNEIPDRLRECPPFMQEIVDHAVQLIEPQRIVLFGSRARSDHRWNSDYDLCFWIGLNRLEHWQSFREWVFSHAQTLLNIDLVDWNEASEELKKSIDAEGVIIYEQS